MSIPYRYGTTGVSCLNYCSDYTGQCQFLIGTVQPLCIQLSTSTKQLCQFLIGTVQLIEEIIITETTSCQFLIGTVQRYSPFSLDIDLELWY